MTGAETAKKIKIANIETNPTSLIGTSEQNYNVNRKVEFTMKLPRVDNDFSSKKHVHAKVEEEILLTSINNKKCLVNLWSKLPFCYVHWLR